jgi:magnesium chelatase family protein
MPARGQGAGLPGGAGPEAAWAGSAEVIAAPDLIGLLNHFKGNQLLPAAAREARWTPGYGPDLAQVKGQETAKRALEIAAAGGHNLLMVGPPGAGKSLLASCLPRILPPLDAAEALGIM